MFGELLGAEVLATLSEGCPSEEEGDYGLADLFQEESPSDATNVTIVIAETDTTNVTAETDAPADESGEEEDYGPADLFQES